MESRKRKYSNPTVILVMAIGLAVLGLVMIICGINSAHTFFGYHFEATDIAMILVGFMFIGGGIYYAVSAGTQRSRENGAGGNRTGNTVNNTAASKILYCPGCGKKLRVPAGKGNIQVTCPCCGRGFRAFS